MTDALSPPGERHPLQRREIPVRDRVFILHRVPDVDRLLDEILARGPDSIEMKDERLPYWSEIWPSSIALADWLLEEPLPAAAEVLELGCGPALAGIAAAHSGCRVTLSDFQHQALALARHNWLANHPDPPRQLLLDWREPPADPRYDVLLASDVAYERRFFTPLTATFRALLRPGGVVRMTEPGRGPAAEFFARLKVEGFSLEHHTRPADWEGLRHTIHCYRISCPEPAAASPSAGG